MSTTKRKVLLVALAISLVAALAVAGTLMLFYAQSNTAENVVTVGSLGINLHEAYDEDGDGVIDDWYKPVGNNFKQSFAADPGGFIQKVVSVSLTEDSVDAYVRVKATTTVELGELDLATASNDEKEAYYSKFAAALFTIKDGLGIYRPNQWYLEFDLTSAEEALLNDVINGTETPETVTFTGYLYYGANNTPTILKSDPTMLPSNYVALGSVVFPAYQTKGDFLDSWNYLAQLGGPGTGNSIYDFLNDNVDFYIPSDDLFDIAGTYVDAGAYPLAGAELTIELQAQAVQVAPGTTPAAPARDYFTPVNW